MHGVQIAERGGGEEKEETIKCGVIVTANNRLKFFGRQESISTVIAMMKKAITQGASRYNSVCEGKLIKQVITRSPPSGV